MPKQIEECKCTCRALLKTVVDWEREMGREGELELMQIRNAIVLDLWTKNKWSYEFGIIYWGDATDNELIEERTN